MIDPIKSIKRWQLAALGMVLLVGIGTAYGTYAALGESEETTLNGDQQLVPVTRGDLINDVSISPNPPKDGV